jgi:hypothetical protein
MDTGTIVGNAVDQYRSVPMGKSDHYAVSIDHSKHPQPGSPPLEFQLDT